MLDDLKLLHTRDPQDTLGIVERQWQQLGLEFEVHASKKSVEPITNVVYASMGGSSIAALFIKSWLQLPVPMDISREYDLPDYVSPKTLCIAASYSGNTEETLSAVEQARAKGAQIMVITHGGKLADFARQHDYPLLLLPDTQEPRYAALGNVKALLVLLVHAGLVPQAALDELAQAADFLKQAVQAWLPTVPVKTNPAKRLAQEALGQSAVIYSGPKLWPAAYKWKIGFNENAKQIAWGNQYPEFNHNEFMGWTAQPPQKPYAVFELRSSLEHERVQKRFELSERLLSGRRPAPHVVQVEGKTMLEQLLWAMALGDFVTIYTALLSGLNPAPLELVDTLKKLMG